MQPDRETLFAAHYKHSPLEVFSNSVEALCITARDWLPDYGIVLFSSCVIIAIPSYGEPG
jgi:hypothetical protein